MKKTEFIRFLILRSVGNFLLLFAIFGVIATFGPSLYYEILFRISESRGVHYKVAESVFSLEKQKRDSKRTGTFADVLAGPKEQILIPFDTKFGILIPKIGANAEVFPNIDPASPANFLPVLRKGVAHAKGTVFPGTAGNIYLFAHSTDNFWDVGRYNAIFYLLKDLKKGDEIVMFYQGVRYNYVVSESRIVSSSDVSYIIKAQENPLRQQLILQTCWPPGTTWQRLLVFAHPKT